MLPKTFFAEMAEKSPIVIAENRLYQVMDISNEVSAEDYLEYGSQKFFLFPSDSLLDLESIYRYVNAKEIFEFKREHIKNYLNSDISTAREIVEKISSNSIVSFLISKVFPLLYKGKDDIDTILSGGTPTTHANIFGIDSEIMGALEKFDQKASKISKAKAISYTANSPTTLYSPVNRKLIPIRGEDDLDAIISRAHEPHTEFEPNRNINRRVSSRYQPTLLSKLV